MQDSQQTGSTRRTLLAMLALAALALLLWGGYGHHWTWTGINGHTATLWDWLKLMLLPSAFAALPIWLRHDAQLQRQAKLAATIVAGLLLVLALAGYLIPWNWTGFPGNTLWDWLNLVALPLAVTLAPILPELRRHWLRRHHAGLAGGLAVFAALVLAGYLIPWAWTGFTGNTVWDWLHLLVLPLLVPTILVPLLRPVFAAHTRPAPDRALAGADVGVEPGARRSGPPADRV